MPNTWRPTQPPDFGSEWCGVGSPVGPALAQRRMEATRGLCLELISRAGQENWQSWAAACADAAPKLLEHRLELVQNPTVLTADMQAQVGLCDLVFRTSSAEPQQHRVCNRSFFDAGAPVQRTAFFDLACACLVPPPSMGLLPDVSGGIDVDGVLFHQQFQAFTEAACGKYIPKDAYGSAGDVIPLMNEVLNFNRVVHRRTTELVDEILRDCPSAISPRIQMDSYSQVYGCVANYMTTTQPSPLDGPAFRQRVEGRALAVKSMHSAMGQLRARVHTHLLHRCKAGYRFLEDAEDDAIAHMARYLDSAGAASLMQTCRQFAASAVLRGLLPDLHVRNAVGAFPHHRVTSFDRTDLANGDKRARMRDFVCANKAVHLYIDFVAPALRPVPLKKKQRTDGLDNRDHDFSDDDFEDPPELRSRRGPQPEPNHHAPGSGWWAKHDRREKLKRSAWELAEGPDEPVDRHVYMERILYGKYFAAPLDMTVALVYADDHSPVPCIRSKHALDCSTQLMRDHCVFRQPFRYAGHMAPAHAKFHVRHLTLDHDGRLFKLRIEARGRMKVDRGGQEVKWIKYTAPFEVVSKNVVVKQASKRCTERERQARIRATKESAKRARP